MMDRYVCMICYESSSEVKLWFVIALLDLAVFCIRDIVTEMEGGRFEIRVIVIVSIEVVVYLLLSSYFSAFALHTAFLK